MRPACANAIMYMYIQCIGTATNSIFWKLLHHYTFPIHVLHVYIQCILHSTKHKQIHDIVCVNKEAIYSFPSNCEVTITHMHVIVHVYTLTGLGSTLWGQGSVVR